MARLFTIVLAAVSGLASVSVAYVTFWKGPLEVERERTRAIAEVATQTAKAAQAGVVESREQIAILSAASAGSIEEGQKLCRVLREKQWRDGLIVPKNWSINLCRDYMLKSGGTQYQLGCIYPDGLNLGGENGTIPSPNCGWS